MLASAAPAEGIALLPPQPVQPSTVAAPSRSAKAQLTGRVSRVTTASMGPSVGKFLLLAYLPPEHAVEGNELRVMYMNELYPVTVARVGSKPLFDPDDARMKC